MIAGGIISRISRTVITQCRRSLIFRDPHNHYFIPSLRNCFHSLHGDRYKWIAGPIGLHNSVLKPYTLQGFGISSSASPESNENETTQNAKDTTDIPNDTKESEDTDNTVKTDTSDQKEGSDDEEMSMEDLVKLVSEKEELLKTKQEQIEILKDKVLRTYAETENVMERTKREAENSKKFAIQNFAKSLLDVADNLGRASSVVKESYAKIDASQDGAGAVPLLKTLLEGVEMTEKQLSEVFKKFGVEKYDPTDEQFDPNRHNAVFQVPDSTKPPDNVAVVLKAGYMLHDRVLRPAEVGVTIAADDKDANNES
ncbi:grpE protein homolog 2, mitochondrial-like [Rutidosis leptorrhynchoides]|uniref:grpE protein homolog 2, mitochondrial-like n=1 Tax=Rutidosis leptorrhynchoides TaxID=125765 RepID=UPI003A99084A